MTVLATTTEAPAVADGYFTQCEGTAAPEIIRLPERLDTEFAVAWYG